MRVYAEKKEICRNASYSWINPEKAILLSSVKIQLIFLSLKLVENEEIIFKLDLVKHFVIFQRNHVDTSCIYIG